MKRITIITILLFLFNFFGQSQNFEISIDTIIINVKGEIGPSVKNNNKYYCFFETSNPNSSKSIKYFYILSLDGKIEHKISVPDEMNTAYYDLHIRNDSIITKTYWNHSSYYLDLNIFEWIKIDEVDDKVFEDERWYVNYLDFGEWGCTSWFRDKNTGKEYEAAFCEPVINKINNIYYVTSDRNVYIIEDPLKMMTCTPTNYYNIIERKKRNEPVEGTIFYTGTNTLFKYSDSGLSSDFYIATSFVSDNQFFQLCVDDNNAYIATIKNGVMVPVKVIGENISVFDFHYSYRCKFLKDNCQLLHVSTKCDNLFGFIEICGNSIKIHYFKNKGFVKYQQFSE